MNILFICTVNKMRSKTAEDIYKDDPRFTVKSAGLAEDADVRADEELLLWADYIITMEKRHSKWLNLYFPHLYPRLNVFCLDIPDIFYRMAPELVALLKESVEKLYEEELWR
ncbi:MAG: phosphotyrosine protein phosphatase [bacterium]|nr:phosphotyrosine protein phosphatase [bacterium]